MKFFPSLFLRPNYRSHKVESQITMTFNETLHFCHLLKTSNSIWWYNWLSYESTCAILQKKTLGKLGRNKQNYRIFLWLWVLYREDHWSGILECTDFATESMYHTTWQATPSQLVFGREMILNTLLISEYKPIRRCKQELIDKKLTNRSILYYVIKYYCGIKSEQILEAIQRNLPGYQDLDKWNFYHM